MIRTCSHCHTKNRIPARYLAARGKCGQCKQPLPPQSQPIEADASTFDDIVQNSPVPVLVDFWAEWCGPCKMIGPALEELSEEYGDKIKIVKVNVDENPNSPAQLGVRGIPALFLFKDGEIVSNRAGAAPKAALKGWIDESI